MNKESKEAKTREESVLVYIMAKGGGKSVSVSKLSTILKKYVDILTLEDAGALTSGQRVVKIFDDHVWMAELSLVNLG
ncbi:MAG: hypothetical protein DRJ03_23645 [Chloroflexi bacterium]|nr:MAG: hypothetical protein DRJ03_23645 [Chloroflexota bacterium]